MGQQFWFSYCRIAIVILGLMIALSVNAQKIDPVYLQKQWKALWIKVPNSSPTEYGVYIFRKGFELTSIPKEFPVYVSADNRYKLYVNEKLVSLGPARGDVLHWNFETVDLAPYLHPGKNIVAAKVWNEGEERPEANISLQTGFILQGGTPESQVLNTGDTWKCVKDESYKPLPANLPNTAYAAGPGEFIDMQNHIISWQKTDYDDSQWKKATFIFPGYPKNKVGYGGPKGWQLVPSILPQMEMKEERLVKCVRAEGLRVPDTFPAKQTAVTIPANTVATLLLDQSHLTNAYPTLIFSGGKNATITLGYAEALYSSLPFIKNNRNEIKGKVFRLTYKLWGLGEKFLKSKQEKLGFGYSS